MPTHHLYVDGSWIDGSVGYGAVLLREGELLREWSGHVPDEHTHGTRQVAGELFAVGVALRWCKANGVDDIHIYFDYQGIESWATGKWKAKQDLTQRYRNFIQTSGLRLTWHKVAAHTGVHWNERADVLAKAGTGKTPTGPPQRPTRTATKSPTPPHTAKGGTIPVMPKPAQSTPTTPSQAELQKREAQVAQVLENFRRHLSHNDLETRYLGFLNGMFGRLEVLSPGTRDPMGFFDLYHTLNKPMTARPHGLPNPQAEQLLLKHWTDFRAQR